MGTIRNIFHRYVEQKKWRKHNSHNNTIMGGLFNRNLVHVGNRTYGVLNVINHSDNYQLFIGNYCSIAPDVMFLVCGEHPTNRISTFPFRTHCCGEKYEATSKGNIIVNDDVWIGTRAIIMSGVTVGRGAVIAAGSIVTHDVAPYTIVGGVPAKAIQRRVTIDQESVLNKFDFNKLDDQFISEHIDELYREIESNDDLHWVENMCI